MNTYAVLADCVIGLHVLYIVFVLLGQLAVMVGWPLGWCWIRNPWFRIIHLAMIAIVAVEASVEFECPLTTLEYWLRVRAGQIGDDFRVANGEQELSFIGRYLQSLLFYEGITDILTWCYYGFAAMVVATLFLVPPRFRRQAIASAPTP